MVFSLIINGCGQADFFAKLMTLWKHAASRVFSFAFSADKIWRDLTESDRKKWVNLQRKPFFGQKYSENPDFSGGLRAASRPL